MAHLSLDQKLAIEETKAQSLRQFIRDNPGLNAIGLKAKGYTHQKYGSLKTAQDKGYIVYRNERWFDNVTATPAVKQRLEALRTELKAECISQGELHELQSLSAYIDADDVELLEAAGVPEFPE